MVAGQITALHPRAVVQNREPGRGGIGVEPHRTGAGIERIRDDLGEDGLLERARISVPKILQQMQKGAYATIWPFDLAAADVIYPLPGFKEKK